jgi:hypothetical protein
MVDNLVRNPTVVLQHVEVLGRRRLRELLGDGLGGIASVMPAPGFPRPALLQNG